MKRLSYTLSALALATASPAVADTLASDLWAEWQAQAELTGQTISADVAATDTGLTLSNLTTLFEDENLSARGQIDQVQLTENPDGTVTVTYSELYTVTFTFEVDPGDPPGNIELLMRHENLDMRVSGDPGARSYAYTADSITVTDGRIWGGDGEPPSIDLDMVMTDINTTYTLTGTDPDQMRFASDGSLGGLSLVMEVSPPPGEEGHLKAGLMIGPMQAVSEGTMVSLATMNQLDGALPEGFDISGSTSYGPLSMEMAFEDGYEAFAVTYANDGGTIGASISPTAIAYDIAASGASAVIVSRDAPVPIEISVGASEIALLMPVAASDTPQDMGLRVGLEEVVLGESLLGMVDPGRAVPRDPASILFDATGQLQLFMDLMNVDPEALTGPPGELRALSVNELRVAVGGAELTGTADLTFAPNQLIPMPVGSADLNLSGGNALLDSLIAGGFVPNEQGLFIRGAANVFARPGAGPDTLETTVEFGANGSITANGIPLQ